ncbi:MAG: GNAT family N-acetyltransferase [Candidatus Tumulicola sp.]
MNVERAEIGDTQAVSDVFRQARAIALPYLPALRTVACCAFRTDWVDHLYILPEYARRGTGRSLMGKAKAAHRRLQLWVFQRNEAARASHEAMGFTLVKRTEGTDNEEREPDALYQWPVPFDPSQVIDVE